MRAEGITYKTIAEELGMSLGSVKMFVSHRNRNIDRSCEQCGKLLPKVVAASQWFCSPKCKTMCWNVNPTRAVKKVQHTCAVCRIAFMSSQSSIFCSRACYYASMRKQ